ncbi:MAG: YggS family pyridoxal phosphate-dependent enzyme [Bythopirellula sp.]
MQERIAQAAALANRAAAEIELVAVTKYVDVNLTAALLAAGCQSLGESRPQQLWEKAASSELAAARWHLVGHLQRNKVQRTLPLVDLIHSVDSLRLLQAIDKAAAEQDLTAEVLLEVNCSGDAAKHGLTHDGLKELLPQAAAFSHVKVRGLMTMAARSGGASVAARNFAALRELRDEVADRCPPTAELKELSMGMSHDFEVAIREGATLVRIGSALFEGIS